MDICYNRSSNHYKGYGSYDIYPHYQNERTEEKQLPTLFDIKDDVEVVAALENYYSTN